MTRVYLLEIDVWRMGHFAGKRSGGWVLHLSLWKGGGFCVHGDYQTQALADKAARKLRRRLFENGVLLEIGSGAINLIRKFLDTQ